MLGLLAGSIGALGADDFLTGTNATIHYHQPDGSVIVEEQGEDVEPGRLLLYPALVLGGGTIFVLPWVLIVLGVSEALARGRVREGFQKAFVWFCVGLPGLLALTSDNGGFFMLIGLTLIAFTALVQLPRPRRPIVANPPRSA